MMQGHSVDMNWVVVFQMLFSMGNEEEEVESKNMRHVTHAQIKRKRERERHTHQTLVQLYGVDQ
jgi:hypothetical protein